MGIDVGTIQKDRHVVFEDFFINYDDFRMVPGQFLQKEMGIGLRYLFRSSTACCNAAKRFVHQTPCFVDETRNRASSFEMKTPRLNLI